MANSCPYCGKGVGRNADLHISQCPCRSENSARIIDTLQYLSKLGVMPSKRAYDECARTLGLAQSRLLERVFGGWDQVAFWCGLVPASQWDYVRTHTARLVLHDLCRELHDGEFGPTISEYQWYSPDGVPSSDYLRRLFGPGWNDVLGAVGVVPASTEGRSVGSVRAWREFDDLIKAEERLMSEEPEGSLQVVCQKVVRYRNREGRWVTAVTSQLR